MSAKPQNWHDNGITGDQNSPELVFFHKVEPMEWYEHESIRDLLEVRVRPVREDLVQPERIAKELQQQEVQIAVLEQDKGTLE